MSPSDPIDGCARFEALVCEFHWTALQIGAIASCMNASLASRRSWMLRACSNLVPVESPVVKVALRSWQDIGLPRDLAAAVARIYFNLADAKKLALPLINSAGIFAAPKIPLAKLEQITAVWRKLAEDCRDAVLELEPETRWRLNGTYTGNALVLSKFLKEAMAGLRTCVNQYGEVALPLLPQRRKMPRYMLLQHCKIFSQGSASAAFARDLSKNDLSVDCDGDFRLKDAVVVVLRSGRKLPGLIVWFKDGKAGVRFNSPLPDDDLLISD
ncbi:type IV pilus assembly PilZ [Hyphomicrobium denitrificans 1NES1]|uniref:Type IV pilus assembly PilZ n=1 Tax=Hyphomicrobium denitrificans 1NES1 TaxID=670307 RepID=N0B6Y5_9HYPH|nr:type IV pilus assembly PilZ [Hyphomicrobium denitrificans 1NES1]